MNIRAALWVMVLAAVALAVAADDDYEYEDEEVVPAPAPVKPLRPSPLLRQTRGPVIGRPAPKSTVTQKTTTTEAPPPEYEEEELEEEIGDEEEVATTTTEAPKRGFKNGVVRPFRSNADLIETLKRRRQQHQGGNSAFSTTSTTAPPPTSEKSFKGGRRASSNKISSTADQTGSTSERKATVNGRRFGSRGGKVTEAPIEEESVVEEQPSRSRLFGRGRRI